MNLVELLIIANNQWKHTEQLIESVLKKTNYPNYRISIIDNASTDDTVNSVDKYAYRMNVIHNENRMSFSECCNSIIKKTSAVYTCILTNEICILNENWLSDLITAYESEHGVGIISPIKNHIGKKIIGGKLDGAGNCINLYEEDRDKEKIEWFHSCCFLFNNVIIRSVGCFDERFKVRYYEEVDLCVRVLDYGHKLICHKSVEVDYLPNEPIEFKRCQEQNRVLFVNKNEQWIIDHKGKAIKRKRRKTKEDMNERE